MAHIDEVVVLRCECNRIGDVKTSLGSKESVRPNNMICLMLSTIELCEVPKDIPKT